MTTATQTPISLEVGCRRSLLCRDIASGLLDQLRQGYEHCSVLQIPEAIDDWRADHRSARKRAARARRFGYRFQPINRSLYTDDIWAINTSATHRQGRPMTASYRRRPSDAPLPAYACARHSVRTYGVLRGDRLRAYLWLYRAGDLALVSSILGHASDLADGIMFLLFDGVLEAETWHTPGVMVYTRHDSGTDGLRFFKERLGFAAAEVAWLP